MKFLLSSRSNEFNYRELSKRGFLVSKITVYDTADIEIRTIQELLNLVDVVKSISNNEKGITLKGNEKLLIEDI